MDNNNHVSPCRCQQGVPVNVWGKKYRLMKKVYATDDFVEFGVYDPSNERELQAMIHSAFEFGKYMYSDFKIEEVESVIQYGNIDKWAYSFDGEDYYGNYDSREDAIKAAREDVEADRKSKYPENYKKIYTGMQVVPQLRWFDMAEDYIESMQENLDDDCAGRWSENFSNQVSSEDEEALDEKLNAAVEEWIKERKIEPGFFLIDCNTVEVQSV